MAQLDVTELDFETIKESLKAYFQAQDEFSDYDFEGSALNLFLDTLAYNTHYNAILAHMQANEAFLDTAIKRSSVVSHAKALGYTPRSVRGATARINLTVQPPPTNNDTTATVSRDAVFSTVIDNKNYYFYPRATVTAQKEIRNGTAGFYFDNLDITEGTRISNSFLVNSQNLSQLFIIPNLNVDTSTLRVRVQQSGTIFTTETFSKYTNLVDVGTDTKAYFVEEDIDGLFGIRFGDGYIGKKLTAGNIVIVDYIASNGITGNNASSFSTTDVFTASGETVTVSVVSNSSGGQAVESIDSIRKTAPRFNQTRNRAVTASDYESLILASNSNIQSVSVWGGEDNDPPIYGKVFISLDPLDGQIITQSDLDRIQTEIIAPKAPLGILAEFVDPEYVYIQLRVGVVYDPNATGLTQGGITSAVSSAISDYFRDDLNVLGKNFYLSSLHEYIKTSNDSIVSVNINPKLQKRFTVAVFSSPQSFVLKYNNKVEPRTLHSTWFNAKIEAGTYKVKLVDVPDAGVVPPDYAGTGKVYLQDTTGDNVSQIGTINYDTGRVDFTATITSYTSTETFIRVNIKPHDDVKDIKTNILTRVSAPEGSSAVVALPSKNTVLTLDDTVLNSITGARKGLDIVVSQYVEDN